MATEIISNYPDSEPTLTSQIDSVIATTDKKMVSVCVTRDPDGEMDEFYNTSLYAFDGKVELSGLGKLIETRFRTKNRVYDAIEVRIDDACIGFIALYCEWVLDVDFDYRNCFFSAAGTGIVHRNSAVLLSHWPKGSNSYRVKVVGLDRNGNAAVVERDFSVLPPSRWTGFSVHQIIDAAMTPNEDVAEDAISVVKYFAVYYGEIQKIYYLADDPEYLTFCFRNIFNVPEYVDVVGKVTRKTKADRDLAVCNGHALQYNRSVTRTYEIQTAALTDDQARELEQLISSHQVQLCTGSDTYDVIITDHTCDVDNDDGSLISIKFSFRFANSRPTLRDSEMGSLLSTPSQIFSNEFTAEFA